MIDWPDMYFPPVNLYSLPLQYPRRYLTMEANYCKKEVQDIYYCETDDEREKAKDILVKKKEEFNRLWNNRAAEG